MSLIRKYITEFKYAWAHTVIPNYHWQWNDDYYAIRKQRDATLKQYKREKKIYGEELMPGGGMAAHMIRGMNALLTAMSLTRKYYDALDDMVDAIVNDTKEITMKYKGYSDRTTTFTIEGSDIIVKMTCDIPTDKLTKYQHLFKCFVPCKADMEVKVECRVESEKEPLMIMYFHDNIAHPNDKYPAEFRSESDAKTLEAIKKHFMEHFAEYACKCLEKKRLIEED
jgi:hypothetical protein